MAIRVTIDTNCINVREAHTFMNQLEKLAQRGLIEITTTFALGADLTFDKSKYGEARRAKASRLPTARSGFMIGRSTIGGPDVVGGPDVYAHVDPISEIIAPGITWEAIDNKTQRDILHLSAHLTYSWDIFLTEDKGILKYASELDTLGIRAMTPEIALQQLEGRGIC